MKGYAITIVTNKNTDLSKLFDIGSITIILSFEDIHLETSCKNNDEFTSLLQTLKSFFNSFDIKYLNINGWLYELAHIFTSDGEQYEPIYDGKECTIFKDYSLFIVPNRYSDNWKYVVKDVYTVHIDNLSHIDKISETFESKRISNRIIGVSVCEMLDRPKFISNRFIVYNKQKSFPKYVLDWKLNRFIDERMIHPVQLTRTDNMALVEFENIHKFSYEPEY